MEDGPPIPITVVGVPIVDPDTIAVGVVVLDRTIAEVVGEVQGLCRRHHREFGDAFVLTMHKRVAEEMLSHTSTVGPTNAVAMMRDMLRTVLSSIKQQPAKDQRDTLQRCFVEMISKETGSQRIVFKSFKSVMSLLAEQHPQLARAYDYPRGSVAIKLSTTRGTIELVRKTANEYLDDRNAAGASYIIRRSVDDMIAHVEAGAVLTIEALKVIRTKAEDATSSADVVGACRDLVRMLTKIAREETNPAMRVGLDHPIVYATEPEFPQAIGKGSCCVIT